MQVFLPFVDNLKKSAESLDDSRLNKQITEINQILLTYVNRRGGHSSHPVNKWYNNFDGICFLLEYQFYLCSEYSYRNGKTHMGEISYLGFSQYFLSGDDPTVNLFPKKKNFLPAFIQGSGVNQIISTKNVSELYQNLLTEKWENDTINTSWAGRRKPIFN